jgi:hypothetical protein
VLAALIIATIALICGFYKHGYQTGIGDGCCYAKAGKIEAIRKYYPISVPIPDPLEERCGNCEKRGPRRQKEHSVKELVSDITIIGKTFKVQEMDTGTARELNGRIDYFTNEIAIDNSMAREDRLCTLTHEIVHGVLHAMAMDLKESDVRRLGRGLHAVLKDNPNYLQLYLRASEQEGSI